MSDESITNLKCLFVCVIFSAMAILVWYSSFRPNKNLELTAPEMHSIVNVSQKVSCLLAPALALALCLSFSILSFTRNLLHVARIYVYECVYLDS